MSVETFAFHLYKVITIVMWGKKEKNRSDVTSNSFKITVADGGGGRREEEAFSIYNG